MERRRVPGRRWKLTLWAVNTLIRWGVSANVASAVGMLFGVLSGFLFYLTIFNPLMFLAGAIAVFLRSAFNIFDGMIAHRTGKLTPTGAFLNDFTDRVADVFMLIGYGYAYGSSPFWGLLACVGALLTASVRLAGKVAGSRMHYGGVMSKPVRMWALILTSPLAAFVRDFPVAKYVLIVLAAGTFITVVQRTWWILRELS
ncbi:MAG: CDP-alcohol phosphatidyltransferase family protein [Thermotogae bacterium]|nr:CDP-alcohol phosphatidyltransferase family protein [Thermotogota bacterium]